MVMDEDVVGVKVVGLYGQMECVTECSWKGLSVWMTGVEECVCLREKERCLGVLAE